MRKKVLNDGRRKFIGASLVAIPGAAVVGSGLLAAGEISAQTKGAGPAKEPMVIGYRNKKGIQIERVTYPARNMDTEIAAYIFKPAGFDKDKKYPAIVVTHPFGGVKEQTSGLYSAFLAEQGFVTLAFDKSYQGESGGEPRFHGGAFVFGSGSWPGTSGVQFAKQGVVLITFNYRLGRLGFFAFPALSREHPEEIKGNYAYMDQIAALKWVERNIAASRSQ